MAEGAPEKLDDLMLGSDAESVSESDEKFRERVAAAQAKLAAVIKDEKNAKNFDLKLAKIIPKLHKHTLKLVVFLIDNEIPSLTILAMISLVNNEAEKICHTEFSQYIQERADFSEAKLDSELEKKISLWWTYILAADHISSTTHLYELQHNDTFVEFVSLEFSEMLKKFLVDHKEESFDQVMLEKILQQYQKQIFTVPKKD
ncbi:hypothetical protein K9M59_02375 [Candidatus Gracilibacteria bacterium]|nr:hypothetical protein [Candidatus Gracilibacteria bacterium]MCF7819688.1 hypothetical protein [Candidatus Gracilibacteria bacterium]